MKSLRVSFISALCACAGLFLHAASVAAQTFEVRHFAGNPGGLGTADGIGNSARFQYPEAVWGDGTYLYISDQTGHAIRRLTILTGEVRLIAGGLTDSPAADGIGTQARFHYIRSLWGDGTYLYIVDLGDRSIRRMTLATLDVVTLPIAYTFRAPPTGIWGDGRSLYVTENGVTLPRQTPINGSLLKIDLSTLAVRTLNPNLGIFPEVITGDGREVFVSNAAQVLAFDVETGAPRIAGTLPDNTGGARTISGMWTSGDGILYVSDWNGHRILRINSSTQEVQPVLGLLLTPDWVDGAGSQARLREPSGIWGDGTRLYVVESGNHVIRAVDMNTMTATTLAGIGIHRADHADDPVTPSAASWSDGTYLYFATPVALAQPSQIWRMPLSGGPATVFAGAPASGYADGPPDVAQFTFATALWGGGSFLYVIDGFGDRLRKISLATGNVSTLVNLPSQHLFNTVDRSIWGDGTSLFVSGRTNIYQVDLNNGAITNVAGSPDSEGSDDGIGPNARFRNPRGLWGDSRHLYIADWGNSLIRRMSIATREVTTLARSTPFSYPANLWGDGTYLYIRDDYSVRRLTLATNEVATIAGAGSPNALDGFGTEARFTSSQSFWGVNGVLYLTDNLRVRTVNTATAEVLTIAGRPTISADGNGTQARFNKPTGIWGDANYLYVTDRVNHALRRIDRRSGETTTVAGIAGVAGAKDGIGIAALFATPTAICSNGTSLYIAELGNNKIRKVTIGTWRVETFAANVTVLANSSGLWCDKNYIYVGGYTTIVRISIATGASTVLVSNLNGVSPLWSDGRFLYFSGQIGTLKKISLATSEITSVASIDVRGSNIWGDGRYLYVLGRASVRRVDLASNEVSLIAGNDVLLGSEDAAGDVARFNLPQGIWSDGATLYIADTDNDAIRTISLGSPPPATALSLAIPKAGIVNRAARDEGPLGVGYARVKAIDASTAASGMAVYGFRSNGVLVSETGVPAVAPVLSGRVYAETTQTTRTGLAIANPNSQSVAVSLYFTDAAGQNFGAGSFVLDANRQVAAFLDEAPFSNGATPAAAKTFTFSASQPVAAIALRGFVNERGDFLMTTLPIADLSQTGSSDVVIPHFAEGGGWTTQIALVNPTDANLAGTVRFFNQSGNRIDQQPYSIPARSSISITRTLDESAIRAGSVHVTPATGQQTPAGISIFSFVESGVTVTQTGVPTMAPASTLRIYGENSAGLRSGFAFANAASQPAVVSYEVLGSDGSRTGMNGSFTLPANGQRALFLSEFPGSEVLPANFKGMLRITATGGMISAIGLRGRVNERGEFLVSTTMPEQNSGVAATELFIPHFVHGDGYTTEFILMGSDSDPNGNAGLLQFYSQQGLPAPLAIQ